MRGQVRGQVLGERRHRRADAGRAGGAQGGR